MSHMKRILAVAALVLVAHVAVVSAGHRLSTLHKLKVYKYETLFERSDVTVSSLANQTCLVPTNSAYNFPVERSTKGATNQVRSWCLRPSGGKQITWDTLRFLRTGKRIITKNGRNQSVHIIKTGSNSFTFIWYGRFFRISVKRVSVTAYGSRRVSSAKNAASVIFLVVNKIKKTNSLFLL